MAGGQGQIAVLILLVSAVSLLAVGCESTAVSQPPTRIVAWKRLGSWSGRANMQTETFMSDTGSFRVHWETKNESAAGKGTLKVAFRSGDSGRVIIDAVDRRGVGSDTTYVGDQVRWYYLTIDAANIEWSVTVEEPVLGHTVPRSSP
jgi:hypothetical protein